MPSPSTARDSPTTSKSANTVLTFFSITKVGDVLVPISDINNDGTGEIAQFEQDTCLDNMLHDVLHDDIFGDAIRKYNSHPTGFIQVYECLGAVPKLVLEIQHSPLDQSHMLAFV